MRFLPYLAIDCFKILQMTNWICLTLTSTFSILSKIILSRYDQLKKWPWKLKVTKHLKSIQWRVGRTQDSFLISAFIIRYKGCAFIFECCWNAFLQFMAYLTWLLKATPIFNSAIYTCAIFISHALHSYMYNCWCWMCFSSGN